MGDLSPEQLRDLIREILEEQNVHTFHRRQAMVRFQDPDGKPWYSATLSRVQALSAVLALLATIFAGIWSSMAARDSMVVFPRVKVMIEEAATDADRLAHDRYFTRPEAATLSERLSVSKAEREQQFNQIQAQLTAQDKRLERIEAMLERLARR
ncbi:MAG: hypothetical protein BWX64_02511 [Acidobacteria bacterium ADurb.Bin051]|jgi:hypothetical protein|nr:MAG: hypothetical protein BWX64_02511 [Acidobacteria bacterium ADurb.Bin051]